MSGSHAASAPAPDARYDCRPADAREADALQVLMLRGAL